jgi:hypothetical protein
VKFREQREKLELARDNPQELNEMIEEIGD